MTIRTPFVRQEYDRKQQERSFVRTINALLRGRSNNTTRVTLRTNQTTTEVEDSRVTADTETLLIPRTATAAAAADKVFATATLGKVTITHDSSAAPDRTFGVVLVG